MIRSGDGDGDAASGTLLTWSLPARSGLAVAAAMGVLAIAIACIAARPFTSSLVSFDAAASVIHFERIASGHRLEYFITTTPKPLLTVLYGGLHALLPDWRALTWLTIAAYGLAVAMATALARRLAGWPAAIFAGIALAGAPTMLADVAVSNAVVWALLGWLGTGLLLTRERPRYGWSTVLLTLAALARPETLIGVGLAVVVLVAASVRPAPAAHPSRAAFLLALAGLALPIMCLHDWLLTGNPLFWSTVEVVFSNVNSAAVMHPPQLLDWLARRYEPEPGLVLLAVVGFFDLLRRREWVGLAGVAAFGPGVAAFLLSLSLRGIYVSDRYAIPIDLTLVFAGAIGAGAVVAFLLQGARPGGLKSDLLPLPIAVAGAAVVALAAVLLSGRWGPTDPALRASMTYWRTINADADAVMPTVRASLGSVQAISWSSEPDATGGPVKLIVPVLLRPRFALDANLPLWEVQSGSPFPLTTSDSFLIFHDRTADVPPGRYPELEIDQPTTIDSSVVTPLLAQPSAGCWVLQVEPAQPAAF